MSSPSPPTEFAIRAIRPGDNTSKLSLGHEDYAPLKAFLRKQALKFEAASVARTYVLVAPEDAEKPGRVWGYITLVACDVQTTRQNRPSEVDDWPIRHSLPAVKLARLAIDKSVQRDGKGRSVMNWAIALIKEHVASRVGCRLLVTDAKRNSIGFYERLGFTMLNTAANLRRKCPLMFIHLPSLR